VGGPDLGRLDFVLGGAVLTTAEGGILGQGVAPVSLSVSLLHLCLLFHYKTLCIKI
jgi:hypothetical protein